jgi:hypothetical protein
MHSRSSRAVTVHGTVTLLEHSSWVAVLHKVAIGFATLVGLMRLPEPIWGDQALFLVGAQVLDRGGHLYQHFWDVKPPGIYGLYWLAGKILGFHGLGIHLFELGWMLGCAILLQKTLTPYFRQAAIGQIFPWLMVGTYYVVADERQLSQLECFINLPLFLLVWLAMQAAYRPQQRSRWLFLSGLMGGIVLIFKVIFLPIVVALWLVCLGDFLVNRRLSAWQIVPQMLLSIGLGCVTPLLPIVLYLAHIGNLQLAYEICFVLPKQLVKQLPMAPPIRLVGHLYWFVRKYIAVLSLAGLGIYQIVMLRRGQKLGRQLLSMYMLTWLGIGVPVILIQTQSWWSYHLMLLLTPLFVLAAQAVDRVWTETGSLRLPLSLRQLQYSKQKAFVNACLCLLVGMNLVFMMRLVAQLAPYNFAIGATNLNRYQIHVSPAYSLAHKDLEFLQTVEAQQLGQPLQRDQPRSMTAPPLPIQKPMYVIGHPVYYLLSGQQPSIALQGWSPEILLPQHWQQLEQELTRVRPEYIYILGTDEKLVDAGFNRWRDRNYRLLNHTSQGKWYQANALIQSNNT